MTSTTEKQMTIYTVNEGESVTLTKSYAGVSKGFDVNDNLIYYAEGDTDIAGIYGLTNDFLNSGQATAVIDSNLNGSFTFTAIADQITEGTERFYVSWGWEDVYIDVLDTSKAPSPPSGGGGGSGPITIINGNNNIVGDGNNVNISIENTVVNGRQYLSNGVDSLTGQRDFSLGLLDGNDFLEVDGGASNFANGNNGSDNIIVRGGQGRYLGGADNDRLEVTGAEAGTWVNGNRGDDVVTGSVDGVTYRGGSENDTLLVSAGTVWGDLGADVFQPSAGQGVAIVQDYTAGEDVVQGIAGGSFTVTADGLIYGVGSDQMLLLAGITDVSQVTVI